MEPCVLDETKMEHIQEALHEIVEKYEPSAEELASACARVISGYGLIKAISDGIDLADKHAAKKELADDQEK